MRHKFRNVKWVSCFLWLLIALPCFTQEIQPAVKGIVKNETSEPMVGVTVLIENKRSKFKAAVQTDATGTFVMSNLENEGSYSFTFTYVGYERKVLTGYNYKKGEMITLVIKLEPLSNIMNDVVIVGYGTQKKINLTGAVDQVSGEELENRSVPNLNQGLQGLIPNLNIVMNDGKPIQAPSLNIRGNTSIGQGGNALVLIDGVEGDPSMINPNDVASVTVLKDAASAAIYGARGAFGVVLITTKSPVKGKTSITYSSSYSIKQPTTVPDMVTNGYQFAKNFNEAWTAWNDYSQTPQNVNKTVKFSPAYLAEFEKRDKDPSLPKVDVNSNGEYVYYENTDWYDLLYKKHNSATEHNLSFTGSTDKASFYLTGRYYGQEGLFRYNSDDYKIYNIRAKGSMQVLPWLRIDNNTDYSNMKYHNPINVGEGGGVWRNIADEGHMMAPLLNPDGNLSWSAAYTVGDFYYGKNGVDIDKRIFKNTTAFTASFLKDKLKIRGDITILNLDSNTSQVRVPVPYSAKPGIVQYVGASTNDLQNMYRQTQYIATNLYGEYETRLNDVHSLKAMAG
ncbi:MAG TPA: TonB-dependent receptor plug domain-containing protein, partial [Niastella sp.]|nr:TonB-dependent receptor plug domain-containing protein [Niastella sp.]